MLKQLNLIGLYVADPQASVKFYEQLGFKPASNVGDGRDAAYVQLGNFKLQFVAISSAAHQPDAFQKEAFGEPKGTGIYLNIEVANIDELFQKLRAQGIKTSSEPRNWPWGQREFALRDPDGYKLVMYEVMR